MEGNISNNFNVETIEKIRQAVALTIGESDWLTRKEMFEGLESSNIPISTTQLYKDIELLGECRHVVGFNYFKGDRGFDRSTATIIVVFRWLARNRSRGQAIVHLPEVLEILEARQQNNIDEKYRDSVGGELTSTVVTA